MDGLYRVGDYRVVADCIDLVHEVLGDKKDLLNDDMISIFIHSKTHGTRKNCLSCANRASQICSLQ